MGWTTVLLYFTKQAKLEQYLQFSTLTPRLKLARRNMSIRYTIHKLENFTLMTWILKTYSYFNKVLLVLSKNMQSAWTGVPTSAGCQTRGSCPALTVCTEPVKRHCPRGCRQPTAAWSLNYWICNQIRSEWFISYKLTTNVLAAIL